MKKNVIIPDMSQIATSRWGSVGQPGEAINQGWLAGCKRFLASGILSN
jgi:hypothetical protein